MAQDKAQKQTVIRVSPAIHQRLKEVAARRGTTMQDLTENALIRAYKLLAEESSSGAAVAKR